MIRRQNQGSSLLETTLAGAIFAIVLAGLGSALITSLKTDSRSYHATRAQNFARGVLEELRALDFKSLPAQSGNAVSQNGYTATITVQNLSPTLRQIRVVASHESAPQKTYTFLTLRSDR